MRNLFLLLLLLLAMPALAIINLSVLEAAQEVPGESISKETAAKYSRRQSEKLIFSAEISKAISKNSLGPIIINNKGEKELFTFAKNEPNKLCEKAAKPLEYTPPPPPVQHCNKLSPQLSAAQQSDKNCQNPHASKSSLKQHNSPTPTRSKTGENIFTRQHRATPYNISFSTGKNFLGNSRNLSLF